MRTSSFFITSFLALIILISNVFAGITVIYPLDSTTSEYSPPIILTKTQTNTTLGANQTSANITFYVTNNTYSAAPPGGFEDGWGGWYAITNDPAQYGVYWVNDTPANGFIEVLGVGVDQTSYAGIFANLTFPSTSIIGITLSLDYNFSWSTTGFVIAFPWIRVLAYNYTSGTTTTIYSALLSNPTPWTSISQAVAWRPTPGDRFAIIVVLYIYYVFALFGGINYAELCLDNVSLTVTTTNYVLRLVPAVGVLDQGGVYNVSLAANAIVGTGEVNASIQLRNGAYISTPIEITNSTIITGSTTSILFNSSAPLIDNGTILLTASLSPNTTVSILLSLTYRSNGIYVIYHRINITLISP